MAWGLLVFGLALGALAVHPFLSYPLSLRALTLVKGTRPLRVDPRAPVPRMAICTCAYNEARAIEAKLQNLIALRETVPDVELLLYVDAATDATAQIAKRYEGQIFVHVASERLGKTHGMNFLAEQTDAEILVFTDANVMMDPGALLKIAPYFSDPEVGCISGNLNYTNAGDSLTAQTGSLYWKLEESLKRSESELGSMMGADGSLFAVRRTLRRAPPDDIIDDMFVSLCVLCEGHRVIQAPDVRAYESSVSVAGEEFHRKVRIACQAFNVHRLLWPQLRRLDGLSIYMYLSHKLLRWFSIYLLAASVLSLLAGLLLAGWGALAAWCLMAMLVTLAVGYKCSITPFSQMFDILLALLGTGIGVWRSARGEVYQTWKPAASIRR